MCADVLLCPIIKTLKHRTTHHAIVVVCSIYTFETRVRYPSSPPNFGVFRLTKNMDKTLSPKQSEELLNTLEVRFAKNMQRHTSLVWAKVQAKLESNTDKLWSLHEMEKTGGEPDVI